MPRAGELGPDLLLAHSGALRGLALALLGDEHAAEDVLQETFLRALVAPPPRRERLGGWLRRVAEGFALQRRRSEGRRAERERRYALERPEAAATEGIPPEGGSIGGFDAHARGEVLRAVVDAVLSLQEPYEETVLLRYFEGLPPREIARRSGVSVATVSSRLQRAHALLRERLERELGPRHGGVRQALLALVGLRLPREAALVSSAALGIGGLVVTWKTQLVIAAALVAGLLALWLREPAPLTRPAPAAPDDVALATAPAREATGSELPRAPETALQRQAIADGRAEDDAAPRELAAGQFEFELELEVIDEHGRPLPAAEVFAGPTLRRLNRFGNTEWDGRLRQRWRGFEPSLELVLLARRDGFGSTRLRRVSLLAGASRVLRVGLEPEESVHSRVGAAIALTLGPSAGGGSLVEIVSGFQLEGGDLPQFSLDERGNGVFVDPWLLSDDSWRARFAPEAEQAESPEFHFGTGRSWGAVGRGRGAGVSDEPAASVSGTLRDARGDVLPNVRVSLRAKWGALDTETDQEGRYEFGSLHEGPTIVWAGDGEHGIASERLDLRPGENLAVDFDLRVDRVLRARLVDGKARPLAGWYVEAYADAPSPLFLGRATTDDEGRLRIVGFGPGAVRLLARPAEAVGRAKLVAASALWPDEGEQVVVVAGALDPATICFTLADSEGRPIPQGEARLWRLDAGEGFPLDATSSDAQGGDPLEARFASDHLLPGTYALEAGARGVAWRSCGELTLRAGEELDLGQLAFDAPAKLAVLFDDAEVREAAEVELWTRQQGALVRSEPLQLLVPSDIAIPAGDYEVRWTRRVLPPSSAESGDFSDMLFGDEGTPSRDEIRLAPGGLIERSWTPLRR